MKLPVENNQPVGVFDSGVGGLTVVKEILKVMPREDIIYLGDTARLPYGSKTESTIRKISMENSLFLQTKGVKVIVVACNTASAVSVNMLRNELDLPVVGVIESGALGAVRATSGGNVGVIGTKTTIRSNAYRNAIRNIAPDVRVHELATPLLVHLVEENWVERDVTGLIIREYLAPLLEKEIDTLVLGCTHYPFLASRIREIAPRLTVVDSTMETAVLLQEVLRDRDLQSLNGSGGRMNIYFSDMHPDFGEWAIEFLGREVPITSVDLKYYGMEYCEESSDMERSP